VADCNLRQEIQTILCDLILECMNCPFGTCLCCDDAIDAICNIELVAIKMAEGSRWISVEYRLPEPGQYVLQWGESVVDKYRGLGESTMMAGQLINDHGHRWADWGVTHWMPLPNPPKAD